MTSVGSLTASQSAAVANMLWSAMRHDPIFHAMLPEETLRERVGPWFCGRIVRLGEMLGEVHVAEDGIGAAIWMAPGNTDFPVTTMLRAGFWRIPFKIGLRGLMRFNKVSSLTLAKHKQAVPGPHWYLSFIGVAPDSQRAGVGGALIGKGIAKADAAGVPCYLETATDGGRSFFSKQGFEVVDVTSIGDGTVYSMVRQPERA